MIPAAAVVGSNNVVAWRLVGRVCASARFKFASTSECCWMKSKMDPRSKIRKYFLF